LQSDYERIRRAFGETRRAPCVPASVILCGHAREAGIRLFAVTRMSHWIPAFAGMTGEGVR
jgi:hypothetical protein